jgi:hypothetical protein
VLAELECQSRVAGSVRLPRGFLLRGVSIATILLVAACTTRRVPAITTEATGKSSDQTLVCKGYMDSEGYPFGKAPTRPATVVVQLNKDPALTKATVVYSDISLTIDGKNVDQLVNPTEICRPPISNFDRCNARQEGGILKIDNLTAMVSTAFELDVKKGQLTYGGGGLDGGWNFAGICAPQLR